ncbi:uncharacterized protein METZ01_LOCUS484886, partial [marine metagenome]
VIEHLPQKSQDVFDRLRCKTIGQFFRGKAWVASAVMLDN